MDKAIYDHIKQNSRPHYDIDKAVSLYELYTSGKKTARQMTRELDISDARLYKIFHTLEAKIVRAKKQLKEKGGETTN
jgi:predicted DNA-binding protein YlxM (UPF0122 family)